MDNSFDAEQMREYRKLITRLEVVYTFQIVLSVINTGLTTAAIVLRHDYFLVIAIFSEICSIILELLPSITSLAVSFVFYAVSLAMAFYMIVFGVLNLLYPDGTDVLYTYIYLGLSAAYAITALLRFGMNQVIFVVIKRANGIIFPNQPMPGQEAQLFRIQSNKLLQHRGAPLLVIDECFFAEELGSGIINKAENGDQMYLIKRLKSLKNWK